MHDAHDSFLSGFNNLKTITIIKCHYLSFYKTLTMHDAQVQTKNTTGQRTLKYTLLQNKAI